MLIKCSAIVHTENTVFLVKKTKITSDYVLAPPQQIVTEGIDPVATIRQCVLRQTGFEPLRIRLFKVTTGRANPDNRPFLHFIFGCEVGPEPARRGTQTITPITPDDATKLALENKIRDKLLLQLLFEYKHDLTARLPVII